MTADATSHAGEKGWMSQYQVQGLPCGVSPGATLWSQTSFFYPLRRCLGHFFPKHIEFRCDGVYGDISDSCLWPTSNQFLMDWKMDTREAAHMGCTEYLLSHPVLSLLLWVSMLVCMQIHTCAHMCVCACACGSQRSSPRRLGWLVHKA